MAYNQYALTLYRSLRSCTSPITFCALSPLRSCSIFIYSCSCSACTLYTRLCHLIVVFCGEKKDQPIHPFCPQHFSCSSQYSPQVSMAFMLLPSVSFRGSLIIPLGFGSFVRSIRIVQETKLNYHKIWSHCLQSIGARSTCWLRMLRISDGDSSDSYICCFRVQLTC